VYAPVSDTLEPAIASDGSGFLAAWTDQRRGYDVYAARIEREGAVLDPFGRHG